MSTTKRITPASIVITTGVGALLLGTALVAVVGFNSPQNQSQEQLGKGKTATTLSRVLPLAPGKRAIPLEALAQLKGSQVANRARYLLASDFIQQRQGKAALDALAGLEASYPVLAPEILVKRAQAYELAGNAAQAKATWQALLQNYPQEPAAAEALYALGRTQPQYWDKAIAQFPSHPQTVTIAQTRLQQNQKQPQLLLLLARHALYLPNITSVLDQLISQYKNQLQPEDWSAIAFGYWEKQDYAKAAAAYAKAPLTARHAYRAGRGLQLEGNQEQAVKAYQRMIAQFPRAPETPTALLKLAELTPATQALAYLNQAIKISQNPQQVGEALFAKVNLLNSLHSVRESLQTRQRLLMTYSKTEAAAQLRWMEAQRHIEAQDYASAFNLAQEIGRDNPDSEVAPQAAFWSGKWAHRLGRQAAAKKAFQQVLVNHPESYYAWRAAVQLGWDVGDFATVRQLQPQITTTNERLALPTGSASLQELYRLQQDREAWVRWQWEYRNRIDSSPEEQLTDGLLRLGVGDNLDGLFMLENLQTRSQTEPQTQAKYQLWQQQPEYWQALYPLPFLGPITNWSKARELNPLLVMALIRQESRFQPQIRSAVGATGLMQVMPETANWIAQQIKLPRYKLDNPNDNIKLGTWYLDYTHQEYQDNSMLAVASYNAGPGNVADWAKKSGQGDPDAFVEAIPFPETLGYVKAVFENYWNYQRLYNPEISELMQKES